MKRWQISGPALRGVITGRKALAGLSCSPDTAGIFTVVALSSLPPAKRELLSLILGMRTLSRFYD